MYTGEIYITGTGVVTPLGVGMESFRQNIAAGKCAITRIPDMEDDAAAFAGLIQEFDPRTYLSAKLCQDLEPYARYAYIAAEEALHMSGLDPEGGRVGIVMASALSGMNIIGQTNVKWQVQGRQAGPKYLTKTMGNVAASYFAINHYITGPDMTVSTACSSGGDAITLAAMMLRMDMADAVIVMAGESAVSRTLIQSLKKTGALSKTGCSRPFDKNRDGFVLGEGAGALVIEKSEMTRSRGAEPLAKLLGCANNNDAYNPVSPDPCGSGAGACIEEAIRQAKITPYDIGYVNLHGTATHIGDIAESCAITSVFKDYAVPASSTKGATGHMMGAGGVVEVICCIEAVRTGILPVNVGFSEADPECALNIITENGTKHDIKAAMSDALGFGGQNSCVIVGRV